VCTFSAWQICCASFACGHPSGWIQTARTIPPPAGDRLQQRDRILLHSGSACLPFLDLVAFFFAFAMTDSWLDESILGAHPSEK